VNPGAGSPESVREQPAAGRRRPHQLPSGRHGLKRSFVSKNQRDRILVAVAAAAAAVGYQDMSVEAIIERAGVSRRTFYDHFKNKEEAFLAAYDAAIQQQVRLVRTAYLKETTVRARLRAGLTAYLGLMASEPEFARMCIVEALAAGPRAIARRNAAMRMFTEIIEDNIRELAPACTLAELAAETIVGGIHEVVYRRILAGQTEELPGLVEDLLATIMVVTAGARELARTGGRGPAALPG
jgi:AcrR family transcriptional regulator